MYTLHTLYKVSINLFIYFSLFFSLYLPIYVRHEVLAQGSIEGMFHLSGNSL
jgi:hypothetical protein